VTVSEEVGHDPARCIGEATALHDLDGDEDLHEVLSPVDATGQPTIPEQRVRAAGVSADERAARP